MFLLFKKNSAFFIPYLLFLLTGGILLICYNKADIHLFINQYHQPAFDTFFKYWTYVGSGWLVIPVALLLAFVRLRYVIISVLAFLLTFIINDSLKNIIGAPRPPEVFSQLHQSLYFVPGVEEFHWNSFPSGHSAVSFCLFGILVLVASNNFLKFLCFTTALLVAYSRMYLSEHFLMDVYAGSVVGILCAVSSYSIGMKLAWLNKFAVMDKPLINLQKKTH